MLQWLHLSDLHFTSDNITNIEISRDKLLKYLHDKDAKFNDLDYIFISGDILYRNKNDDEVIEFLSSICEAANCNKIFLVPGNHDLERDCPERNRLIEDIKKNNNLSEIISENSENAGILLKAFDKFQKINNALSDVRWERKTVEVIQDEKCNIILINSSIISYTESTIEEGTLQINVDELRKKIKSIKNSKPSIILAHHTIDCFSENNQFNLLNTISDYNCIFYLCGHKHKLNYRDYLLDKRIRQLVSGMCIKDNYGDIGFYHTIIDNEYKCKIFAHKFYESDSGISWGPFISFNNNKNGLIDINLDIRNDTLELSFENLPQELKNLLMFFISFPAYCYQKYYINEFDKDFNDLYSLGFIFKNPISRNEGPDFYVSNVKPIFISDKISYYKYQTHMLMLLNKKYEIDVSLDLLKCYLKLDDKEKIYQILLEQGRIWIETIGLNECFSILNKIENAIENNWYILYLYALMKLFRGEYNDEKIILNQLAKKVENEHYWIKWCAYLEIGECQRRLGNKESTVDTINSFFKTSTLVEHEDNDNYIHFKGVCYFLIGHLLRSFGKIKDSIEYYRTARKLFWQNGSPANQIELFHCNYCIHLCQKDVLPEDDFLENQYIGKSKFLKGLYLMLNSGIKAFKEMDYQIALNNINRARNVFNEFGSAIYITKTYYIEFCIYFIQRREDLVDSLITEMKTKNINSKVINELIEFYTLLQQKEYNRVSKKVQDLFEEDEINLAISLIALINIAGLLKKVRNQYYVKYLEKEGNSYRIKREKHNLNEILVILGIESFGDYLFNID